MACVPVSLGCQAPSQPHNTQWKPKKVTSWVSFVWEKETDNWLSKKVSLTLQSHRSTSLLSSEFYF